MENSPDGFLFAGQEKIAAPQKRYRQPHILLDIPLGELRDAAGDAPEARHQLRRVPHLPHLAGDKTLVPLVVNHPLFPHILRIAGNRAGGKPCPSGNVLRRGRNPMFLLVAVDKGLQQAKVGLIFCAQAGSSFL